MTMVSHFSIWMNLFLAYGLKYMWNVANMLQFVIYLVHWKVNIPANAEVVILQMRKIALFEFIDREDIVDWFRDTFGVEEDEDEDWIEQGEGPRQGRRRLESSLIKSDLSRPAEERFGSDSLFENTSFLVVVALVLFLISAFLIICTRVQRCNIKFRTCMIALR